MQGSPDPERLQDDVERSRLQDDDEPDVQGHTMRGPVEGEGLNPEPDGDGDDEHGRVR